MFHVDVIVNDMSSRVFSLLVGLVNCDECVADVDHGDVLLYCHHHEKVVVATPGNDHVRQLIPRKLVVGDYKIVHGASYV